MPLSTILTGRNLDALLNQLSDGIIIVDQTLHIRSFNEAAQMLSGYSQQEIVNQYYHDKLIEYIDSEGNVLNELQQPIVRAMNGETVSCATLYLRHQKGWPIAVWLRTIPLIGMEGRIIGAAEIFNRVKSNVQSEKIAALAKLAFTDPVTKLYNRSYLEVKLRAALDEMSNTLVPFSILLLSITNLKQINEKYGPETGDKLLQLAAKTLRANNSEEEELLCRWQGAKIVILTQQPKRSLLLLTANKKKILLDQLSITLNGERIPMEAALAATLVRPGDTQLGIIERTEMLLSKSEQSGNRIAIDAE